MKKIAIAAALAACSCSKPAEEPQGKAATQQLEEPRDPAPSAPDASSESANRIEARPTSAANATNPCLVQDGEAVPANSIRAIGTEPFWGASVVGRCVTYSHPDDQDGTRIWTRFTGSAENGRWQGTLEGKPFVMVTKPQPGCSDGMSDNRYPIAVELTVSGERRTGCARPD